MAGLFERYITALLTQALLVEGRAAVLLVGGIEWRIGTTSNLWTSCWHHSSALRGTQGRELEASQPCERYQKLRRQATT